MRFKKASELVYQTLSGYKELTKWLSSGSKSVYPLVAPHGEKACFITYSLMYDGLLAKGLLGFRVEIRVFSDDYDNCCLLADKVCESFEQADSFSWCGLLSAKPIQTDDWLYIEQVYSLKF